MLINFGSGPAKLPNEVLSEASAAIIEYQNSGMSILEIPHRGALFTAILEEAKSLSKALLGLDDSYDIIWLQGGGRMQFAMVPINFLAEDETSGYIDTGHWAMDASQYASHYGKVEILASSQNQEYTFIPKVKEVTEDYAFVHLTTNNTIYGTQFFEFPKVKCPLIADMSSELFSRKLDYTQFDLIYAVAQKNLGPAGVTFVAIKKSLLEKQKRNLPGILSYKAISEKNSVLNTPPVFAIYCSLLVLRWINKIGMEELERRNKEKATLLYDTIDKSTIFQTSVAPDSRSKMNVCFYANTKELDQQFIEFAKSKNITGIKGHRSVGGLRVALYNAISIEDVRYLIEVIREFEGKNSQEIE